MNAGGSSSSSWTCNEHFNNYNAGFPNGHLERSEEQIVERLGTKTAKQVQQRDIVLVHVVAATEAGPDYETEWLVVKRKKAKPWSKEEHKCFLEGLAIYGRSKWTSIANHMKSRTATQVASHAQKYYEHLQKQKNKHLQKKNNNGSKRKERSSIFNENST